MLTLSELQVLSTAVWAAPSPLSQRGRANPRAGLAAGQLRPQSNPGVHCRDQRGLFFWYSPQIKPSLFFYYRIFNPKPGMNQECNVFFRRGYSRVLLLQRAAWPLALSLPAVSHHWNPAAEGEESIFIRKAIKRNFLLKMFVKSFFQQLLSQVKAGWSEVPPAQVLWHVITKFFTSDLKKKAAACFST